MPFQVKHKMKVFFKFLKKDSTQIDTDVLNSVNTKISNGKSLDFTEKDFRDLQACFENSKLEIAKLTEKLQSIESVKRSPVDAGKSNESERMFLEGTRYASSEIYECVTDQLQIIGEKNWLFALNQELKFSDLKREYEQLREKYEKQAELVVGSEIVEENKGNNDLVNEIEGLKRGKDKNKPGPSKCVLNKSKHT